jgi:hypothetical protein
VTRLPCIQTPEATDANVTGTSGVVMEAALRRAMEATRDALALWEARAEDDLGFEDEFDLTADQVAELSDEWRLAYVARLLETLALAYGVNPDTFENKESCPAALLRGLNDLLWMPM